MLINPLRQAKLFDALNVPGARSVSKTIQRMENGFIRAEVGDRQTFEDRILSLLSVFCGRCIGNSGACSIEAGREKKSESDQRSQNRTEMRWMKRRKRSKVIWQVFHEGFLDRESFLQIGFPGAKQGHAPAMPT